MVLPRWVNDVVPRVLRWRSAGLGFFILHTFLKHLLSARQLSAEDTGVMEGDNVLGLMELTKKQGTWKSHFEK